MSIRVREETDRDKAAVFALNTAVFPTDAEAKLVDALRLSADLFISLVAVKNQDIVGHIMFKLDESNLEERCEEAPVASAAGIVGPYRLFWQKPTDSE